MIIRGRLGDHYQGLADSLRMLGRPIEAAEATRECRKLWPDDANELYKRATEFSLCAAIAKDDAQKTSFALEAVDTLKKAIDAGWKDAKHLREDAELKSIRDRDDFKKLVESIESKEGKTP